MARDPVFFEEGLCRSGLEHIDRFVGLVLSGCPQCSLLLNDVHM